MRIIAAAALVLFTSTLPADAAIRYKFKQVTRSDFVNMPSSEVAGEALIDGDRSRIDFPGRSFYGDDTYVISHNGAKNLFVVDPQKRTVAEINAASVATALGQSNVQVSNLKSSVKKLPDTIQIAGVQTAHYRIEMSYDLVVYVATIPIKQRVQTTIDKWTTDAYGPVSDLFLSSGTLKTGNPQLDEIIEMETNQVKGLVLRQTVSIVTTSLMDRKMKTPSKLELSPSRRQTSDMLVTEIRLVNIDGSVFNVPNYPRLDPSQSQEAIHELSMQPAQ